MQSDSPCTFSRGEAGPAIMRGEGGSPSIVPICMCLSLRPFHSLSAWHGLLSWIGKSRQPHPQHTKFYKKRSCHNEVAFVVRAFMGVTCWTCSALCVGRIRVLMPSVWESHHPGPEMGRHACLLSPCQLSPCPGFWGGLFGHFQTSLSPNAGTHGRAGVSELILRYIQKKSPCVILP